MYTVHEIRNPPGSVPPVLNNPVKIIVAVSPAVPPVDSVIPDQMTVLPVTLGALTDVFALLADPNLSADGRKSVTITLLIRAVPLFCIVISNPTGSPGLEGIGPSVLLLMLRSGNHTTDPVTTDRLLPVDASADPTETILPVLVNVVPMTSIHGLRLAVMVYVLVSPAARDGMVVVSDPNSLGVMLTISSVLDGKSSVTTIPVAVVDPILVTSTLYTI